MELQKTFKNYVANFYNSSDENNRMIKLKEEHSLKVVENIKTLGKSLNLSYEDMAMSKAIALFHDIARFEQFKIYKTFDDKLSFDHGSFGVKIINLNGFFDSWEIDTKKIMLKTVYYHNKATLPEKDIDSKTLFFIKLLRDADKLDIWRVIIDYYENVKNYKSKTITLNAPDTPHWSSKNIESIKNHKNIKAENIKCVNDLKLLYISWVFDINFKKSFKIIKKRKYIESIGKTLPQKKEMKNIVEIALNHIKKKG